MVELNDEIVRIAKEVIDKLPEYMTGPAILMQEEDKVCIKVQTVLPVDQALEELTKFNDEWFIDKYIESHGKVDVGLEFI